MREYYVLLEDNNIICIFDTLMDILSWAPPRKLIEPLVIHRIREENKVFFVQNIEINVDIYNHRIGV